MLRVGKFTTRKGLPGIGKVKSHTVGEQGAFYEPYGFTADDRGVLFAANLDPGQSESSLDLYTLRFDTGEIERLTSSATDLDRHASFSPSGRWIVWSSSHSLSPRRTPLSRSNPVIDVPLDLWLMDERGLQVERLTALNDPISSDYAGRVTVTSPAWSPDGYRLLVLVTPLEAPVEAAIYSIQLRQAVGE